MDRREAIKKLAAGTAIASGGSMILSSRSVAYAASAPGTGLIDVPGPSEPLPVSVTQDRDGIILGDVSSPRCGSGGQPGDLTTVYSWQINDFNVSGGNGWRLLIVEPGTNTVIMGSTGVYSPTSTAHGTVELRKANKNQPKAKNLTIGDYYDVTMMVTWKCAGAGSYLQAEYRFVSSYDTAPVPTVQSYKVI